MSVTTARVVGTTSPAARITLAHGSGGKAMHDLIATVIARGFGMDEGEPPEDQARVALAGLVALGDRLAMTTDSFVVDPLFFPGGDIGTLAVNGTVNDLAVGGARPLYLSCGFIIEEGLPVATLARVVASMRAAADAAGVRVVTGDTKVVPRGAADKLFVNTAGVGVIAAGVDLRASRARPGDAVLVNGFVGDHGAAIVDARGELALESDVQSDCQPLHELVAAMLAACPELRCLRDATRGGVATLANEFAQASGVGIRIDEAAVPLREGVRGVCELLGLDPLHMANEGKLVAVVPAASCDILLAAMRACPAGEHAARIGTVTERPAGRVVLATRLGGERVLDMLIGEQLPRIC